MENSKTQTSMPEYLSALLDDEVGEFEQKRVLDELKSNDSLCDKLSTYALIGETMRSSDMEKPMLNLDSNFLAGIHSKLDEEEQYNDVQLNQSIANNQSANSQSWLKPFGGFAMAASVAAIAILGVQNYQLSGVLNQNIITENSQRSKTMIAQKDQSIENDVAATATSPVTPNKEPMVATQEYGQADTQTRSLLKRYVDSHMQYASTAAFVPSVRVIAYTDNQ